MLHQLISGSKIPASAFPAQLFLPLRVQKLLLPDLMEISLIQICLPLPWRSCSALSEKLQTASLQSPV